MISPHSPPSITSRELLLVLVAYHPSAEEVQRLHRCLMCLPEEVGYALVVNDYRHGEAAEQLSNGADAILLNCDNPGYGTAVNRLVRQLPVLPPYLGALNTDLTWDVDCFPRLLRWLKAHLDVCLAVPQICNPVGDIQYLCKLHPTVLALLSRRFIPQRLKPSWLRAYDQHYVMRERDYQTVFDAPYLSGCCMLMRSQAFESCGGFDERFFLYLEDADLTRSLSQFGRCVHLPIASVIHGWGRGNYFSLRLMVVNLVSAWSYFWKWGWRLW